jgi:hypothetical protein
MKIILRDHCNIDMVHICFSKRLKKRVEFIKHLQIGVVFATKYSVGGWVGICNKNTYEWESQTPSDL